MNGYLRNSEHMFLQNQAPLLFMLLITHYEHLVDWSFGLKALAPHQTAQEFYFIQAENRVLKQMLQM